MIQLTITGKKGQVPRALNARLDEALRKTPLGMEAITRDVLEVSKSTVNRFVHQAPAGAEISAQILLMPGIDGGWSIGVMVDVTPGEG